jgi:desulfoferrodoxin-like iron-binding protein
MSERTNKTYFCRICGNEVKFVRDGGGKIICCGEEMQIKKEGFEGEE